MPSRSARDLYENKNLKNCKTIGAFAQAKTDYLVDGAIDPTLGVARLTKGSAGAYTLAAPTAAQNGLRLLIINATAFAHVVTATGLLNDGVTGGAKNAATFGAFVGSAIELFADNLKWTTINKNVVTVA